MATPTCFNRLAAAQRRRALPVLAALLVGLFLLGRLAGSVHLAVVEHGLCPDDGELVHAGDLHSPPPGGPARSLGPLLPLLAPGCDCAETHQHDHCVSAAQRQSSLLRQSWARLSPLPPPPKGPAVPPSPLSPSLKSRHIFRFAPKNSPPV